MRWLSTLKHQINRDRQIAHQETGLFRSRGVKFYFDLTCNIGQEGAGDQVCHLLHNKYKHIGTLIYIYLSSASTPIFPFQHCGPKNLPVLHEFGSLRFSKALLGGGVNKQIRLIHFLKNLLLSSAY
jgi:hypothetical protein